MNILKKIFGTKNARDLKRLRPIVAEINRIEAEYQAKNFSDQDFPAKTQEFRDRVANGESLDSILPEAYALVKNACRHLVGTTAEVCGHELVWNMVPFDVQLIGGIVLHQGKIAEMQTGEGKTLVATLPLYLNALAGKNVQLVTVNDYLARRDATWMGHLYKYLGLTVGCIQNSMDSDERRAQYACDITYGTNSEFGFDYLRDNGMAQRPEQVVQRGHNFAIVDEVDSILIDEARTPLGDRVRRRADVQGPHLPGLPLDAAPQAAHAHARGRGAPAPPRDGGDAVPLRDAEGACAKAAGRARRSI